MHALRAAGSWVLFLTLAQLCAAAAVAFAVYLLCERQSHDTTAVAR